jgi:hypothetical protein
MRTILTLLLVTLLSQGIRAQHIDGIAPDEGNAGTTLNVTISGLNTHFSQATNTSVGFFFSGATSTVTFTNYNYPLNNQTLISNLSIPGWVTDGFYDFGVYNEIDGFMLQTGKFRVRGPRIDSITPNMGKSGQILQVTITGTNTHFAQATSTVVRFHFSGASATATYPIATNIISNTTIAADLEIPATTPTGWYDFSVTNEMDGFLLKPAAFYVLKEIGIQGVLQQKGMELFPNPFTDKLILRIPDAQDEPLTIRVYDAAGTLVEQRAHHIHSGDQELPFIHLRHGVYYFVITRNDGTTHLQKIIRQ